MTSPIRVVPIELVAGLIAVLAATSSFGGAVSELAATKFSSFASATSQPTTAPAEREAAMIVPVVATDRRSAASHGQPYGAPSSDPRETRILELVNAERAKAGCEPLAIDQRLTMTAIGHSKDMAKHGYVEHKASDGSSSKDRIDASGYRASRTGENIAAGQESAEEAMNAWMNSEGHRENILNCNYTHMGVGIADSGKDAPYWTQDFGAETPSAVETG